MVLALHLFWLQVATTPEGLQMLRAGFVVSVLGLACLSACGGSSNPTTPSDSSGASISIVGQNGTQSFTPNPAPFGGQPVAFKNNDRTTHHIVFNDGSFDSGDLAPGASSRTFAVPATGANFHCSIHTGMIGSVNASSGSAAPPCEGIYCSPY